MKLIDVKLEKQLLGFCLIQFKYIDSISPDMFTTWRDGHEEIIASNIALAIITVYHSGKSVDIISVDKKMQELGYGDSTTKETLKNLQLDVTKRYDPKNAIEHLLELAERRKHCENGSKLIEYSNDNTKSLDEIREIVEEEKKVICYKKPVPIKQALFDTISLIDERIKNGGKLVGLSTGFETLDNITQGFQKKKLIVLAARPSMGKTALAVNLLYNVAVKQKKVLFFIYEGDKTSITIRVLSYITEIPSTKIQSGCLRNDQWREIKEKSIELAKQKILIEDSCEFTINNIRQSVRRQYQKESGIDLVIIDHLHLVPSHNDKLYDVHLLTDITKKSKAIAKDFDVPVLFLAQLNRDNAKRPDKKPVMSDLRGSGSIEQDADQVWFIHRDNYYTKEKMSENGPAEIIVAKNRDGNVGTVMLEFLPNVVTFRDMEKEEAKKSDAKNKFNEMLERFTLYKTLSFNHWPYNERAKVNLETFCEEGHLSLLVTSESQQPKMHAFMAVAKKMSLEGYTVDAVRWKDIKDAMYEKKQFESTQKDILIIIDCFENNGFKGWSDLLLFLIKERREAQKKTMILGNKNLIEWINLFQTVENKKEIDEILTGFNGMFVELKK